MLGKIEGKRRKGWWRMRWLVNINDSKDNESAKTQGDGRGPGRLACSSPLDLKESDMTYQLNNNIKQKKKQLGIRISKSYKYKVESVHGRPQEIYFFCITEI